MLSQVFIVRFGLSAIWLANEKNERRRRWAPVCGLLGQPAWIAAALDSHQIGVLLINIAYTFVWARGFWIQWSDRLRAAVRRCA